LLSKLAGVLATYGLTLALSSPAAAVPGICPPICDAIPDTAWMEPSAVPLYPVYRWPGLDGLAVTTRAPRFAFEQLCVSPPLPGDARRYAVAARALVPNPVGQWQLHAQIVHWRGDTAHSAPAASTSLDQARVRLRACQATAALASASLTTDDADRIAAVISVAGQQVMHQYLAVHPGSGTIVELALWSTLPPQVPWSAVPDAVVLDAMAAPLCSAYLGSCR
jgi:hypothetical protein